MMMMQPGNSDLTQHRMLQAKVLPKQARGDRLNLGKKISVPKDVMMEELNLPSNRGSRMFQERQKRVERFTLENTVNNPSNGNVFPVVLPPTQPITAPLGGKENQAVPLPGYGGPLKVIPCEKFNATIIPKSYCSPWTEALGGNEGTLTANLPELPHRLQPDNYRCFNRSAMPFGGAMASKRVIPVIGYESTEPQHMPGITLNQMSHRPNFNRAPRGWGVDYTPESNEL